MDTLKLYVSVPLASFRVAQAREYWESYPCPPPSTVYGMLLSLVGEENRLVHQGAEIALAVLGEPCRSVALRTLWRVKEKNLYTDPLGNHHVIGSNKKERERFFAWVKEQGWDDPVFRIGPGLGANARPDFQELLNDIRLAIWVRKGAVEDAPKPLIHRIFSALNDPSRVFRYGGLSLGESTHLVDELRNWRHDDPKNGHLLLADERGELSLPVWPDHVGSKGTRWGQFRISGREGLESCPPESAWTAILPAGATT